MELINDGLRYAMQFFVDFCLALIFVLAIILHLKKSVIRSLHELLAFIAATFVAKVYSWPLGSIILRQTNLFEYTENRRAKAVLLSLVVIFVLVFLAVNLILGFIEKIFKMTEMRFENKALVAILGALLGFFYVGVAVFVLRLIEMLGLSFITELTSTSLVYPLFVKLIGSYFQYASALILGG